MSFQVYTLKEKPDLEKSHRSTGDSVWPEFMRHDSVCNKHWASIFTEFPEYQLTFLQDSEVIGVANTIPLCLDMPLEQLPEEGLDWILVKGLEDKQRNIEPDTLGGLLIVVNPKLQGKGISSSIVGELISRTRREGFKRLIIPIRPNLKSRYPLISISQYIKWKKEDGLPFDPWIREHVKHGAHIIKPCHRAMYIPGSIADWEKWTGLKLPASGEYVIEGALTPVTIDHSKNLGEYIEPNVWIAHVIEQ